MPSASKMKTNGSYSKQSMMKLSKMIPIAKVEDN